MRCSWLLLSVMLVPTAAPQAQSEAALRHFFEGKSVTLKIDMPGTSKGVEVRPLASTPVDMPKLASSLKSNGTAIHRGESMMVTKVKVKGDHIEFQLGGGGFGTFGDLVEQSSMEPTTYYEGKSDREKDLEHQLRYATSAAERRRLKAELEDERRDRNRMNALNRSLTAQARQQQQATERELRARSGSRFNVRYSDGIPPEALTPEGLMSALARYVDFSSEDFSQTVAAAPTGAAPATAAGLSALRKGLTIAQIEQILGPANAIDSEQNGNLEVMKREYLTEGQAVTTQFIGGVLIDYAVRPTE